jgi:peptidyl-dipeptidase Dcp
MAPKLAAFRDRIVQNEALFKRIEAVYESPARLSTPEQQRLVWHRHTNLVLAGARLDASERRKWSR